MSTSLIVQNEENNERKYKQRGLMQVGLKLNKYN